MTTLKEVDEFLIPPVGVKRKWDGVVDSVLPVQGYEVMES